MCVYCGDSLHKATSEDLLRWSQIPHRVKYLRDLEEDVYCYVSMLILNVMNGVAKNLGVPDPDKLASKPPYALHKGLLTGLKKFYHNFKGFFGRKMPDPRETIFKIKGKPVYVKGRPLTIQQWRDLEKQITDYMTPYLDNIAEEMSIKTILLALASARAERQGISPQQFGQMDYNQIEDDVFGGYVPDTLTSAQTRLDLPEAVAEAYHREHLRASQYVVQVNNKVHDAIRRVVVQGHKEGKTPKQIASDLYWMKDEDKEMYYVARDPRTAEQLIRDWHRVAVTEIAMIHEAGKLAEYEDDARAAQDGEGAPVYMIFGGSGRCDYCAEKQGTIVRLLPLGDIGNETDDSLKARGIEDKNTNIAIWQGKTNYGYKKAKWRVATPVHPYCCPLGVEVMTKQGWKQLRDLKPGDFVYSINSETMEMEYVRNEKTIRFDYEGEMINFKGRGFDLSVTPDHRMFIQRRIRTNGKPQRIERELIPANDIQWSEFSIPRTGKWKPDQVANERNYLIAALYGWYASEGSKWGNRSAKISQQKEFGRDMIRKLLRDLHADFMEKDDCFTIYGDFGVRLLDDFPDRQPERCIPSYIKELPANAIQAFLDAFCAGDGSQRKHDCYGHASYERVYYTSSKRMMADICELILKTGKACHTSIVTKAGTVTKHKNGEYASNHDVYCIRESNAKTTLFCPDNNSSITKEHYSGEVGCPSLERNFVWLFRNNGTVGWTGNCRDTFTRFYPDKQYWDREKKEIRNRKTAEFQGQRTTDLLVEFEKEDQAAQDALQREIAIKNRRGKK